MPQRHIGAHVISTIGSTQVILTSVTYAEESIIPVQVIAPLQTGDLRIERSVREDIEGSLPLRHILRGA